MIRLAYQFMGVSSGAMLAMALAALSLPALAYGPATWPGPGSYDGPQPAGPFAGSSSRLANANIDQEQGEAPDYIAAFSQTDLAQSFQTQQDDLPTLGAGIALQPGIGSSDTVIIELWDGLPNAGGTLLRSGSETGTEGQWVDVEWPPILLEPDTTYYLVFSGNATLGISGSPDGPYPFGHAYANPGFGTWPDFDFAFRTWISGYSLGGQVSGLAPGNSVTLQNNGGDDLVVADNGPFTFDNDLADGESYEVTILTQPAGQNCQVFGGSGTVEGEPVDDIAVTCTLLRTPLGVPTMNPLGVTVLMLMMMLLGIGVLRRPGV